MNKKWLYTIIINIIKCQLIWINNSVEISFESFWSRISLDYLKNYSLLLVSKFLNEDTSVSFLKHLKYGWLNAIFIDIEYYDLSINPLIKFIPLSGR